MSYDPSQANGIKAIQVDINASSVLSDDITTHSEVTIRSRNKYFIDSKILLTTNSSSAGYLSWEKWSNFSFMGGVYRSNAVSGTGTGLDDSNASSNTPNTNLNLTAQSSGSGSVTRKSFRAFWRIE